MLHGAFACGLLGLHVVPVCREPTTQWTMSFLVSLVKSPYFRVAAVLTVFSRGRLYFVPRCRCLNVRTVFICPGAPGVSLNHTHTRGKQRYGDLEGYALAILAYNRTRNLNDFGLPLYGSRSCRFSGRLLLMVVSWEETYHLAPQVWSTCATRCCTCSLLLCSGSYHGNSCLNWRLLCNSFRWIYVIP